MRLTRKELHPEVFRAMMPLEGDSGSLRKRRWWVLPRAVDSEIVRMLAPELMPPWERSLYAVAVGHIAESSRPEAERWRALTILVGLYDQWLKGVRADEASSLWVDVDAAFCGPDAKGWDLDDLARRVENWAAMGYRRADLQSSFADEP